MIRPPPRSTRTDTPFPDTTRCLSPVFMDPRLRGNDGKSETSLKRKMTTQTARFVNIGERTNITGSARFKKLIMAGDYPTAVEEIGRAHVRTPVTNAHLVCRLLLEKNKHKTCTNTADSKRTQQ